MNFSTNTVRYPYDNHLGSASLEPNENPRSSLIKNTTFQLTKPLAKPYLSAQLSVKTGDRIQKSNGIINKPDKPK